MEHAPWPLHTGAVEDLAQSLTTAVGLPMPSQAPLVHFSPGVRRVRIGPSRPRWRVRRDTGPARGAPRN